MVSFNFKLLLANCRKSHNTSCGPLSVTSCSGIQEVFLQRPLMSRFLGGQIRRSRCSSRKSRGRFFRQAQTHQRLHGTMVDESSRGSSEFL